ncbi:winged helix-turn-helix domain-containing protein [Gordonia sp. LSe1-13]|uniref:Winged helix-turn-helix domain-containing protein n=1 Tax=Gordonia sesuvii TaxID=3116777 RepID=A0ABU7MDZ4_9ACTN|nr:winged helix-turn-helix domain-containing protein [Gordonia sp. LSe1-13]
MATKIEPRKVAEMRRIGARRRLNARQERQAIINAAMDGWNQKLIADSLGVSQPHISRTLKAAKRENAGTLREIPPTALDIIDERDAGEISDEQMMEKLTGLDYTDGHVPEVNGVATDAYVRGSWDDIEFAFQRDRLTFEEYSELRNAVAAEQIGGTLAPNRPVPEEIRSASGGSSRRGPS